MRAACILQTLASGEVHTALGIVLSCTEAASFLPPEKPESYYPWHLCNSAWGHEELSSRSMTRDALPSLCSHPGRSSACALSVRTLHAWRPPHTNLPDGGAKP